jgi:hypothetical protein
MDRDVAEQTQCVSLEAGLALRGFDREIGQAPRLLDPTHQQTGAAGRAIGPAAMANDSLGRLTFEELLGFPYLAQRLAHRADPR